MPISIKSKLHLKIKNLNRFGYKIKHVTPSSPFEKHKINFESKTYTFCLSELNDRIADLKKEHSKIKEQRLESVLKNKREHLLDLNHSSFQKKLELAKLDILKNLILQHVLLESTPELKPRYLRIIKKMEEKIDVIYSKDSLNKSKKYLYLANIFKSLTEQIKLRNADSRHRLFSHIDQEILSKPLDQLSLDI